MAREQCRLVIEHRVVSYRVLPALDERDVRSQDVVVAARLGNGGDAPAVALGNGGARRPHQLLARGLRNSSRHHRHRGIDEYSAGRAGSIAHDAAARRIGHRCVKTGQSHRSCVGHNRMAVDAGERDRPVGKRLAERVVRRKRLAGPETLIPPSADNPFVV